MQFIQDDGGRAAAGFKGLAGDCVVRSIAITTGRPYMDIYRELAEHVGNERGSKGATARNGIRIQRKWFKDYMKSQGFTWVPTMGIGTGCTVNLHDGELPSGRLVVRLSGHLTAVINGVIHDTYNPQRETVVDEYDTMGRPSWRIARRCVYGYWELSSN